MELTTALKLVRREKKFAQKEMACLLGITREHYAQIESGRLLPSLHLLKSISSLLNLHITIDIENGKHVYLLNI